MNKENIERLPYIDLMKVIGIYFIIAGHCFGPGYKIIYSFSVPLFFIVSGFLNKVEEDYRRFIKKIFWNLVVPCFIFLIVNILYTSIRHILLGTFNYVDPLFGLINGIIGRQGENYSSGGLGAMWFVYTLILCKLIIQIIPEKFSRLILYCINILCLIILQYYGRYLHTCSCYANLVIALPFFSIGYFLQPYKNKLSSLSKSFLFGLIILGIAGVGISVHNNGIVFLYSCTFGKSLAMCFCGAISGTIVIMSICILCNKYVGETIHLLGTGTLVILGLHQYIISFIKYYLYPISNFLIYFESLLILLMFINVYSYNIIN